MPTVSEVLGGVLQNAIAHPKTTIQSILTSTLAVTGLLLGTSIISPKVAGIITALNVVAKVGLGMLQTDGINLPPNTKITQTTDTTVTTP